MEPKAPPHQLDGPCGWWSVPTSRLSTSRLRLSASLYRSRAALFSAAALDVALGMAGRRTVSA